MSDSYAKKHLKYNQKFEVLYKKQKEENRKYILEHGTLDERMRKATKNTFGDNVWGNYIIPGTIEVIVIGVGIVVIAVPMVFLFIISGGATGCPSFIGCPNFGCCDDPNKSNKSNKSNESNESNESNDNDSNKSNESNE